MGRRANTIEQKEEVLLRLLDLWKANPNLRLAQLIGNVYHIPSGADPYYVEDFDFIASLEDGYKEHDIS